MQVCSRQYFKNGYSFIQLSTIQEQTYKTFLLVDCHKIISVTLKSNQVFGNMEFNPDTEYNRHNNFKTFMGGLQVLFR